MHRARRRFGQHFLLAPAAIEAILAAVAARSDDTVIEIGPGQGALTRSLSETGTELHAIEIDRDLAAKLKRDFSHAANVSIHEADALKFDYSAIGDDLLVVGNLPYNISTPLLFRLVEHHASIRRLVLMLQKEVVQRIVASPGNKSFGRLTIMLGCHMQSRYLFDVSPDSFSPPPKVMSAVVELQPTNDRQLKPRDTKALSGLVTAAFSKRRKTVKNALSGLVTAQQLADSGIDPAVRPEDIPIVHWVRLADRYHGDLG